MYADATPPALRFDWPPVPGRLSGLGECLVLALLVHLLLVAVFGSVPGGSARPGEGVWGRIDIRLAGDGPPGPEPPAAAVVAPYSGPEGQAERPRWGGEVRSAPPAESERSNPGAARQGTWNRAPTALPADPLPPQPAPQPVTEDTPPVLRSTGPAVAPAPLSTPETAPLPTAPGALQTPLPAPTSGALPQPVAVPPPVATRALPAPPAPAPTATPRDLAPLAPLVPMAPLPALEPAPTATPALAAPLPTLRRLPTPAPLPSAPTSLPRLTPLDTAATAPPPLQPLPPTPAAGPAPVPPTPVPPAPEPAPTPPAPAPSPAAPPAAPTTTAPGATGSAAVGAPPPAQATLPPSARPGLPDREPRPAAGAPDAGPLLGHDVATPSTQAASTPRLNLDLPRPRGGALGHLGSRGVLPVIPLPPETDSKLADDIKKSGKADCRTAYANSGVLAVAPLAADALRKDGCRW